MRFLMLLSFMLVFALPARAQGPLLDIQEITSPQGIKAWLVEDHSIPVIALQFAFKGAGSARDPEGKQGLARMASNTMDEGAGALDSQTFQKELRDKAITLGFRADRDDFGGQLKTTTDYSDRAFELLALAVNKPRFDAEPIERMRESNKARIRSSLSDPDWIAARLLNDTAFSGHAYARNSGGTLTSLDAITAEDLRAFVQSNLARDNLYVAVAGDITPEALKKKLDEIFGALPAQSAAPEVADFTLQNQGQVFLYKKDIPQTVIEMLQPGIDRKDPDYQYAQIMNYVLGSSGFGSRLMEEIREKRGLTYGIYTNLQEMDHIDLLGVSTSTANPNVGEMMELIGAEWDKMLAQPVTEEELATAKSYLIGSLPLSLTSTDKIAALLLSLERDDLPLDYLDQRAEIIGNATTQDIQRVTQRLLNKDSLITVMVGKPEGVTPTQILDVIPNAE